MILLPFIPDNFSSVWPASEQGMQPHLYCENFILRDFIIDFLNYKKISK